MAQASLPDNEFTTTNMSAQRENCSSDRTCWQETQAWPYPARKQVLVSSQEETERERELRGAKKRLINTELSEVDDWWSWCSRGSFCPVIEEAWWWKMCSGFSFLWKISVRQSLSRRRRPDRHKRNMKMSTSASRFFSTLEIRSLIKSLHALITFKLHICITADIVLWFKLLNISKLLILI